MGAEHLRYFPTGWGIHRDSIPRAEQQSPRVGEYPQEGYERH